MLYCRQTQHFIDFIDGSNATRFCLRRLSSGIIKYICILVCRHLRDVPSVYTFYKVLVVIKLIAVFDTCYYVYHQNSRLPHVQVNETSYRRNRCVFIMQFPKQHFSYAVLRICLVIAAICMHYPTGIYVTFTSKERGFAISVPQLPDVRWTL